MFFKLVRGGNVSMSKEVLQHLYFNSMHRETAWAIGTHQNLQTLYRPSDDKAKKSARHWKTAVYVGMVLLFILTSPIFYAVHAASCQMDRKRNKKWVSKNLQLPLIYALLSEEIEMVNLFMEFGCSIEEQDSDGNNVYHHLAILSGDDGTKAMRCHEILSKLFTDNQTFRFVVTEQVNKMGYTAWELFAKYGSLEMCCHLAYDRCGFGKLVLGVSKDHLWCRDPEEILKGQTCDHDNGDNGSDQVQPKAGDFNLLEYDVSRYETGVGFSSQSYPLQLFCGRAVEGLKKEDIWAVLKSKFVTVWIGMKIRKFLLLDVLAHIFGLSLTLLLLIYVIRRGGDMDKTPLYSSEWARETYGAEITRLTSYITMENRTLPVYNPTSFQYEFSKHSVKSCMFKLHKFQPENGEIVLIDNCHYRVLIDWRRRCSVRCECDIPMETIISNSIVMKTGKISTFEPNLLSFISATILCLLLLDIGCRLYFLHNNFNWNGESFSDVVFPVLQRRIPGSYLEKNLNMFMYHLYVGGLILNYLLHNAVIRDIGEHTGRDWRNFHIDSNVTLQSLKSHVDEHIRLVERKEFLDSIVSKLIIICLLLRFIQAIFVVRLLPYFGFFIITAKKMAHHLLQFTVVFVIVLLAFGTIFFFIMRNESCPAIKIDGFQTLMASLFSVYYVSLGYGELDFSLHLNAQLAYVAFTVTATLLLLNLIIAVMTTTVDDLNESPWKNALNSFELWNEILGIEAVVLTLENMLGKVKSAFCHKKELPKKKTFEVIHWSGGNYFE